MSNKMERKETEKEFRRVPEKGLGPRPTFRQVRGFMARQKIIDLEIPVKELFEGIGEMEPEEYITGYVLCWSGYCLVIKEAESGLVEV